MNQPLYTDLLNASLILVAQKNNRSKINSLKAGIASRTQALKELTESKEKPREYRTKKGWGWFLSIFCGMFFLMPLVAGLANGALTDSGFGIAIIIMSAIFLPLTILGILLICSAGKTLNKYEEQKKQRIESLRKEEETITPADIATITQLEADSVTLQKAANELLAFLPETYRNTEAACYMLLAVKDGRTDTLKEAMNLYEEQLHRWKMEKLAANSARMQQIYMESMQSAMREIADHQEQIQGQLSAIAGMQAMEMWRNA